MGGESPNASCPEPCLLYVRVNAEIVGKTELESLLGCEVLYYVRLVNNGTPLYKVKIKGCNLSSALAKGRGEGCYVAEWQNKSCKLQAPGTLVSRGIRFQMDDGDQMMMSVILPCLDLGVD